MSEPQISPRHLSLTGEQRIRAYALLRHCQLVDYPS